MAHYEPSHLDLPCLSNSAIVVFRTSRVDKIFSLQVEGLDEDNARLMVKLTISGKLANLSQYNVKLVTSKEYNKYSKYISKLVCFLKSAGLGRKNKRLDREVYR